MFLLCLICYCLIHRQHLRHFIWFICRLQTKLEDLEHLMNDEVTDINEAIKVINNLQVGFIAVSIDTHSR